ncbi:hypothetical protein FY528_16980 [Hymenobacter lutimineralis]|uniref:Uncharacterized protein n=1 Tax=Hymenobacter lutimineralis TaxID=2606448 RepID=A0A5D6UUX8_9BACT|nr:MULTISPECIES: hypothetical protein [Hymenobacter]QIX60799.1 hypothetical protein HER32_06255 [Hymenobacter sp. BT18]TYZ06755.1 hypothetical protein FY528_16980 [Hymenobacter lutimineralis]
MSRLPEIANRALRLVPAPLWWVLAALVLAMVSTGLSEELWLHTPAAVPVARMVAKVCLVALPVLGAWWLWRIAGSIAHRGWRWLAYAVVVVSTAMATLLALLGCLAWVWWQ